MVRIEGEILIRQPVERVFDFVADERNEPLYNRGISDVEQITDGPIGAGTQFVATVRAMGRARKMILEYTEFERPRKLASRTIMSTADISGTLEFEPAQGATRMRWSWQLEPRGVFALLAPALVPVGRRQERAIWTNLKRHLEGSQART
ncbi:SRPBCC family protein [Saccharomonospora sp. NPDC046836]|uniref:SRPBCC family protein n=1 Tax=Saccharomonospora sp. NPDC046836 TaxID=3156921 RepID=UPI0033CCF65D